MKGAELEVQRRDKMQKNELSRFRKTGNIPAVLYGKHLDENILFSFDTKEFNRLLHRLGRSVVYSFKSKDKALNGKSSLIKEVQKHPVRDDILHVDMVEVTQGEKVHISVALDFIGTPAGVKNGGVLDIVKREIEVECLPTSIPEVIEIDVSELQLNDVLHISDIKLPDGVFTREDLSFAVAGVKVVVEKVAVEEVEGEETGTAENAEKSEK